MEYFEEIQDRVILIGVQGLQDLPEMDPVQLEDFKAEAEEEIQLKLDV